MNVKWILCLVMPMLTAPIPVGVLLALVGLDILGMDLPVMVCWNSASVFNNIRDFLFHIVIPPPIDVDGTGMVNVGRAFRLPCRSTGDFSGAVVWMKAEEDVTSIGLYSYHYSVHQNYHDIIFFLFPFPCPIRYCKQWHHYTWRSRNALYASRIRKWSCASNYRWIWDHKSFIWTIHLYGY